MKLRDLKADIICLTHDFKRKFFDLLYALHLVEYFSYEDTIDREVYEIEKRYSNKIIKLDLNFRAVEYRCIDRRFYYSARTSRKLYTLADYEEIHTTFYLTAHKPQILYLGKYEKPRGMYFDEEENKKYVFNYIDLSKLKQCFMIGGKFENIDRDMLDSIYDLLLAKMAKEINKKESNKDFMREVK